MLTRKIYQGIVITALLLLSICETYAQTIDGTTSVNAEETYYYSISGSLPSGAVWHAYYGDVISSSSNGASVKWRCGMSTGTVYVTTSSNQTITYKDVTINQNPTFNPGSISATAQYVNYNGGTTITGSNATGGTCNGGDYYYQWETSSDGQNFSAISGATALDYSMGSLTASVTYYRRGAKRGTSSSYQYSNVVDVHAYPQLIAGTINPGSQNINPNATPGPLSLSGTSGGNNSYSYQWQSSTSQSGSFNSISGATSTSYTPPALTGTMYYMVQVVSNGTYAYTAPVVVNVYQPLSVGPITPSAISINYNTSPGALTSGTPSGGNGTYTYQWWSSTDNTNYSIVSGAQAQSYSPGNLSQTMYYKVEVKSNGVSVFSGIAVVTVLQLAGVPAPTNITGDANTNMNWVRATGYDATGNIVNQSKEFYDYNGGLLQSQSKAFYRVNGNTVYSHVFASQPIRDAFGRNAAATLGAPIDCAEFNYKPDFVQAAGGSSYSYKNFDAGVPGVQASLTLDQPGTSGTYQASQTIILDAGFETATNADFVAEIVTGGIVDKTNSPDQVGKQNVKGTLGWYYSSNNTWEPYTPTTDYPFSRQTFYTDGTGNVKKSTGVGKPFKMGSGHEMSAYITPVINELDDYIRVRNQFFSSADLGTLPATLKNQAIQTIARDVNGKEGIVINDKGGKALLAARTGTELMVNNSVSIPGNNIHYFKLLAASTVTISAGSFIIKDMDSEQPVSFASGGSLPAGYYQVSNTGSAPVTLTYSNGYADVSYSFYNQLGQLVATIAPEGVKKLYGNGLNTYVTKNDVPFISLYQYDVKGRLIKSASAEGGTREMVYRTDGKIRFSQNTEQIPNGRYNYINYDELGRPIEAGEYWPDGSGIPFNSDMSVASPMHSILNNTTSTGGLTSGEKKDVVMTLYDIADNSYSSAVSTTNYTQEDAYLGGTISMTKKYSSIVNNAPDNNNIVSATWYNYNEEGKVVWMIEFIKGLGYKTTDYSYDVLGRLVKKVFEKKVPATDETFVHYYEYDAVTQNLWKVYTAKTEIAADKKLQATYIYYLHGPLKRIELGGDMQGIDYTYTLNGTLKAINNSDKTKDPGVDGSNGFNADAFGMVLDYHPDDYENSRLSGIQPIKGVNSTGIGADSYAGNIRAMTWFSRKPASEVAATPSIEDPTSYIYQYDDKYRFTESTWGTVTHLSNAPATFSATGINKEKINLPGNNAPAYDANGNMLYLQRTYSTGAADDRFTYKYLNSTTGNGSNTDYNTNKLESVVNEVNGVPQTYASYIYDKLGQLTVEKDVNGAIRKTIKYDVTGKALMVERNAGEPIVEYVYNEAGKRIIKKSYNTSHQLSQITYYVGDVIYTQAVTGGTTYGNIVAQEYEVQGASGRLGIYYRQSDIYTYELNDHLGNVRAVVAKSGTTMEVRVYADYYPYGMRIRGADGYRYGYQGQHAEKDDETGWNAFELRMYDSKIARWLSVDPKGEFWSPYVGMGNDPVKSTDPDGGSTEDVIFRGKDGKEIRVVTPGDPIYVDVPFDLLENRTIKLDFSGDALQRLAFGYTVNGSVNFSAIYGGTYSGEMTYVKFTNKEYGNYWYVYGGGSWANTLGDQVNIGASVGLNIFVAVNTQTHPDYNPGNFAGETKFGGIGADYKELVGGGVNAQFFTMSSGWSGVSVGANVGVGAGANSGSIFAGKSYSVLFNNIKKTRDRSFLDRVGNETFTTVQSLTQYFMQKSSFSNPSR
jgi:RHS repeat-associated protein